MEIEKSVVYKVNNSYLGFIDGEESEFLFLESPKGYIKKHSARNIDYRTNTAIKKEETVKASPEETQWFLECHKRQAYISLGEFRKLNKNKEFNHYN